MPPHARPSQPASAPPRTPSDWGAPALRTPWDPGGFAPKTPRVGPGPRVGRLPAASRAQGAQGPMGPMGPAASIPRPLGPWALEAAGRQPTFLRPGGVREGGAPPAMLVATPRHQNVEIWKINSPPRHQNVEIWKINSPPRHRNVQIWDKIRKIGLNQVQMARFGLIFNQNRSHMSQNASDMPPGPQNPPKNQKYRISGFG